MSTPSATMTVPLSEIALTISEADAALRLLRAEATVSGDLSLVSIFYDCQVDLRTALQRLQTVREAVA